MWYIFRALALVLPYVFWRHLLHVQRSSNLLYNCMLCVVCANTHYRFQGRHTEHNRWTLSNVWEGPSLEIKRIFLNLVESIDFHFPLLDLHRAMSNRDIHLDFGLHRRRVQRSNDLSVRRRSLQYNQGFKRSVRTNKSQIQYSSHKWFLICCK